MRLRALGFLGVSAIVLVAVVATVVAQTSANPTFEAASIKPNNSGDGRVFMQNPPGSFVATNINAWQEISA